MKPDDDQILVFAQYMAARDTAEFGYVEEGVAHPTWEERGDMGQEPYLKDAKPLLQAAAIILGAKEDK